MTKKYNIVGKYIKDMSSETPDIETYLFVRDRISKYQLGIDINSKALKNIMVIADKINAYVSNQEPWNKAKNGEEDKCIKICSEALNVFKDLTILLQPFIPSIAEKIFKLLNTKTLNYDDLSKDNLNKVQKFQPFITRLEKNDFDGILD